MKMMAYRRSLAFEAMMVGSMRPDGGRYGADTGGIRWRPVAAIAALHAVALYGLVAFDVIQVERVVVPPTVIELLPDDVPPPPPASPEPAPPVASPVQVVAPPPLILTPAPPVDPVQTVAVPPPPAPAPVAVAAPVRAGPVSEAVVPPDFDGADLGNPAPRYPVVSRKLREQGTAVIRVTVSAGGRGSGCRVQRSSGFDRLDKAALGTVCGWKFLPATRGGQPIEWPMDVPIPFVLRG